MAGGGAMNDNFHGYNDNLSEANNAELGPDGIDLILPALAEGIAASATDADEALELCRDAAQSENLDEEQFLALVRMVEDITDWELPGPGDDF
ncbi:MAG TPA: hypothetical protein VLL76_06885 [Candidatus Omnitrophota bacterium]|nr:hypothetical protein [Candidatus Omnitrophota bacterium]